MMADVNDKDVKQNVSDQEQQAADGGDASMENWAEVEGAAPFTFAPGEIVEGVVIGITNEGVAVDIGAKYEGLVSRSEFTSREELPAIDSKLEVAVMRIDEENGVVRLSKRRADFQRVWNDLEEKARTGGIVDAMVTDRVKGGLRVDVGVPGFVPASQVGTRDVRSLERFVGRSLRLKVLEADRKTKKVVLSHRIVVEEEREKRREETLSKLEEGAVVEGKVRNLTSYGAFIDLGGVDGLLHVSEMSWSRIKDPSEVLSVGETVQVTVLEIDREKDKISLSLRQILPDPWKEAARKLRPGQLVQARITRVVRTGAFALLKDADIEGFIPVSEMSSRRISDPSELLKPGQDVDLKIMDIRIEARRMTLSLQAAEQERERREYQDYMAAQESATVTLGDRFGALLKQVSTAESPAGPGADSAAAAAQDQGPEAADEQPPAGDSAAGNQAPADD